MRTSRYVRPEPGTSAAFPGVDTLIVGRVLTSHGIRGEMSVEPLTDDPTRFKKLKRVLLRGREYPVASVRVRPNEVLLRLEGISTPEEAKRFRGEYLHIEPEDAVQLPEGAYYHFQLIGLRVQTTGGDPLGELSEVIALESNDVYVVRGERGEVLVPATNDVVREIDLPGQMMTVEPVAGLLPWEDQNE